MLISAQTFPVRYPTGTNLDTIQYETSTYGNFYQGNCITVTPQLHKSVYIERSPLGLIETWFLTHLEGIPHDTNIPLYTRIHDGDSLVSTVVFRQGCTQAAMQLRGRLNTTTTFHHLLYDAVRTELTHHDVFIEPSTVIGETTGVIQDDVDNDSVIEQYSNFDSLVYMTAENYFSQYNDCDVNYTLPFADFCTPFFAKDYYLKRHPLIEEVKENAYYRAPELRKLLTATNVVRPQVVHTAVLDPPPQWPWETTEYLTKFTRKLLGLHLAIANVPALEFLVKYSFGVNVTYSSQILAINGTAGVNNTVETLLREVGYKLLDIFNQCQPSVFYLTKTLSGDIYLITESSTQQYQYYFFDEVLITMLSNSFITLNR